MTKLITVFLNTLYQHFCTIMNSALHAPILRRYSSDTTPVRHKQRFPAAGSSSDTHRSGLVTERFLCQCGFLRSKIGDVFHTAPMLSPSVPIGSDTHWGLLTFYQNFGKPLKQLGHLGVSIEHQSLDRLHHESFTRVSHQWLKQILEQSILVESSGDNAYRRLFGKREMQKLLHWPVSTACTLHDCQNALKWCASCHLMNDQVIKDCHIGIESIRNSQDLLFQHLSEWLVSCVRFKATAECQPPDLLESVWNCLGVDPETCEKLVELRLIWQDGYLECSSDAKGHPEFWGMLSTLMFRLLSINQFTASRWLSLGGSSQSVLVCRLLGLDDLVGFIKQIPGVLKTHIGGYSRLATKECTQCCLTCAMVASIPEAAQLKLMEDSRLVLIQGEVREALADEMEEIQHVSEDVWGLLNEKLGGPWESGFDARRNMLKSANVCISFIQYRFLGEVRRAPWFLAGPNARSMVDRLELADWAHVTEPIAAAVKTQPITLDGGN